MSQNTKIRYTIEEVNTLMCMTRIPEDGDVIDYIAISDDDDTIIVGRYEIAELIEYLQRMYDVGAR